MRGKGRIRQKKYIYEERLNARNTYIAGWREKDYCHLEEY
jgi:hypothetical protein